MRNGAMRGMLFVGMLLVGAMMLVGCAGRPSLIPNPDPALRKSSSEFAADAAKRFPYKADAPHGGEAVARSQVGYMLNRLDMSNLSDEDWMDVEIWVNQAYVVHLPAMEKGKLKRIPFQMLFNDQGQYFPLDNHQVLVERVQVYRDGVMYDIPNVIAD